MKISRKRKPKNSTARTETRPWKDSGACSQSRIYYAEDQTLAAWIAAYRKRSKTEKYSASASIIIPIPRDIIFNILLLLSATVLHKIMRYVCKEWNDIISDPIFIRAHLLRFSSLSPGLVLPNEAKPQWAYCLNTSGPKQLSEHKLPFPATIILDSCNGLLLLYDKENPEELHVMNLATIAKVSLPPMTGVRIPDTPYAVLTFTPSQQYKVVVAYASLLSEDKEKPIIDVLGFGHRKFNCNNELYVQLMACTVAVDKTWRAIDCNSMPMNEDADVSYLRRRTLITPPISKAGFVYWYSHSNFVLILDVDAETMYQVPGPKHHVDSDRRYRIITETGVGMVNVNKKDDIYEIWEMVEPRSGTWVRCRDYDIVDMYCRLERLLYPSTIGDIEPLLSSENGMLWFSTQVDEEYTLVCYNGKTGYVWSLPIRWPSHLDPPHFHINSLLSLKDDL